MALRKDEIADLYRKRAGAYDLSANLYYLIGFREMHYRRKAVSLLDLKGGDTVVDLGCGTGLNFGLLRKAVGPEGRVIGVDLTPEMLERAEKRIRRNGWGNVALVQGDASDYRFPEAVRGIVSSFAITLMPEYDRIIRRGAEALVRGGRFVVLDFKRPETWPEWLVRAFVFITSPFGVTLDLAERKPWESINRYLRPMAFKEVYFGSVYISVGEK
ncbi:MAG: class I SAM-dependent methyltransferase [Nitrospirota bacterium]|jgi:ubiquinone/menaquinone biosynthesis C-methylase UbiE